LSFSNLPILKEKRKEIGPAIKEAGGKKGYEWLQHRKAHANLVRLLGD
jgi:hypothetical protein